MCGGLLRRKWHREKEASKKRKLPPSRKLGAKAIWVIDQRMALNNAGEASQSSKEGVACLLQKGQIGAAML